MRIAYVCADPGVPVFGNKGCSIHVQEMVRAMLARGADVELFVARTGGKPPVDLQACLVHEMTIPKCSDTRAREVEQVLWNQRVVQALGDRPRFDLLYERHSLWSAKALCWARHESVPSILEVNAPLIDEQANHRQLVQSHLAGVLTRQAMRNAQTNYVVSDAIVPYCRRFVAPNQPVSVIPNGVNTERFSPSVKPADSFPGLTIGFIGSLKPWHGLDELLEAFSRFCLLSTRDPQQNQRDIACRLLIVGDGPERDAIHTRLGQCPDLRQKVKLVGAVRPEEVPRWLRSMDVAVAPYPHLENFYFSPLKIFEYMASGRVVLASATGQICEILQHGVNGWLYPAGDVDRLAASFIELRDNKSLRERLGRAARETALQHSWSSVLDQILDAANKQRISPIDAQGRRDEIEA